MRKACDLGDGAGCTFIAATIEGSKAASQTELSQALKLYLEGCDLEDFVGCEAASEMLLVGRGVNADLNTAHKYHLKALELSNGDPKTGAKYKKLLKSINE
jgi:TPR repeat protein